MLYIIASPIGNLEDLTLRSIRILKEIDLIFCEDTRVTKKLLRHYEITKPLFRYIDDDSKINFYRDKLKSNDIALITDAGTPLLSDPGYKLINIARQNMTRWVVDSAKPLMPLLNGLKDSIIDYDIASIDATTLQVLN